MNIRFLSLNLFVSFAGLLALTGCQSPPSEAAKPAEQNSPAAPDIVSVQVTKPIWRKVQRTVQGQGALFAKESVQLSNKLPGYVSKVLVDFGVFGYAIDRCSLKAVSRNYPTSCIKKLASPKAFN